MFLGARTRDCCTPAGVFLAINTINNTFGLFVTLVDAASFNTKNALVSGANLARPMCTQLPALMRGRTCPPPPPILTFTSQLTTRM